MLGFRRLTGSKLPPTSLKLHQTLLLSRSPFNSTCTLFSTYSFLQSLLPERADTSQILEIPAVCPSCCKMWAVRRGDAVFLFFSERHAVQQMLHCLKTGISACFGLRKASAEEMPCYSPTAAQMETETDRDWEGVGSWSYRLQYEKFDFHRLFEGTCVVWSMEAPCPMGVS